MHRMAAGCVCVEEGDRAHINEKVNVILNILCTGAIDVMADVGCLPIALIQVSEQRVKPKSTGLMNSSCSVACSHRPEASSPQI